MDLDQTRYKSSNKRISVPPHGQGRKSNSRGGDSSEMRVLSGFVDPHKRRVSRSSQHICFCGNRFPSTDTTGTAPKNEFTGRGSTVHKSVSRGGGQISFYWSTCNTLNHQFDLNKNAWRDRVVIGVKRSTSQNMFPKQVTYQRKSNRTRGAAAALKSRNTNEPVIAQVHSSLCARAALILLVRVSHGRQ